MRGFSFRSGIGTWSALGALLSLAPLWLSVNASAQTDIYRPYRYKERWTADTLYLGASFRYMGGGPITITMRPSETVVGGNLYLVSPTTGATYFLMSSFTPPGLTVDASALTNIPVGSEVIFEFISNGDVSVPRFTGPSLPGRKFFNGRSSDWNRNTKLRFGHRWSVAGKIGPNKVEFGFEDGVDPFSDMDFNDIIFQADNLQLLIYQNSARKRAYVWGKAQ